MNKLFAQILIKKDSIFFNNEHVIISFVHKFCMLKHTEHYHKIMQLILLKFLYDGSKK